MQDVENKLPRKVAVVAKVPMTPYQSAIYNWVKATGTIRLYPTDQRRFKFKNAFAPLNNKVMEMRKVRGPGCRGRRELAGSVVLRYFAPIPPFCSL